MQKKLTSLSPTQLQVIELMASFWDHRTNESIINETGVNRRLFYEWQKLPEFQAELNRVITDYRYHLRGKAWNSLAKLIEEGNFKAIELYFRMTGEYVPAETRANINLNMAKPSALASQSNKEIMMKLVKAISKAGIKGDEFERMASEDSPITEIKQIEEIHHEEGFTEEEPEVPGFDMDDPGGEPPTDK